MFVFKDTKFKFLKGERWLDTPDNAEVFNTSEEARTAAVRVGVNAGYVIPVSIAQFAGQVITHESNSGSYGVM